MSVAVLTLLVSTSLTSSYLPAGPEGVPAACNM